MGAWGNPLTPRLQGTVPREPSNGEQAGQHTTYPELLDLGPGQGRGAGGTEEDPPPRTPCRPWSWAKSLRSVRDLRQSLTPSLGPGHSTFIKIPSRAFKTGGRNLGSGRQTPTLPPPPTPSPSLWWTTPSISTGMMKSALFTGCRRKRAAGIGARPTRTTLPGQARVCCDLSQVSHPLWTSDNPTFIKIPSRAQRPGMRAAGQGPTLKELCTRVSSRSMTTQILSKSWALASGSSTGLACYGTSRELSAATSQAPIISPPSQPLFLRAPRTEWTPAPSQFCPCQP